MGGNQRDAILEKVRSIPALPAAASGAMALLHEPDVEIDELMGTIQYDPALTSNVLRLANSAYFGFPRGISSLRDAIVRLGFNRLFQLVVASAIAPVAGQPVRGYDLSPGALLEHSIAVAIGAEELARELKYKPPVLTFTAGLLHDLGKIILGSFLEIDARPIMDMAYHDKVSFEVAEQRILGIDHAEAGAALLERWELPADIVAVVRWHHQPDQHSEESLAVDLVHAADHLSLETGIGAGVDGLNYQPSAAVMARLMVKSVIAETVLCRMMDGLEELRELVLAPSHD